MTKSDAVAVLASGGLDSAVLMVELTRSFDRVIPLYVRCGLVWEAMERHFLNEFLKQVHRSNLLPARSLDFSMRDVYSAHWSASGNGIPAYSDPDEDWEIPGRNLVLLTKAAIWSRLNGVSSVALGTLHSNPFPDASPQFFEALERTIREGLGAPISVLRPLEGMHKEEVIRLGRDLPLQWTLSCASPVGQAHCGRCGKCRERRVAFRKAGIEDPTDYDHEGS